MVLCYINNNSNNNNNNNKILLVFLMRVGNTKSELKPRFSIPNRNGKVKISTNLEYTIHFEFLN